MLEKTQLQFQLSYRGGNWIIVAQLSYRGGNWIIVKGTISRVHIFKNHHRIPKFIFQRPTDPNGSAHWGLFIGYRPQWQGSLGSVSWSSEERITWNGERKCCWPMRQCCRSCDSGVIDAPVPSTWRDSAGDHATVTLLMRRCRQHDATVLSIMPQWRRWCAGAVNMMRQRWRSCDSGIVDAPVPSTWCDSAVNHATVAPLTWWCSQHDATALAIMRQWCHWCASAVSMTRQRWQSCDSDVDAPVPSTWCDSAINDSTVGPLMRRCCQHDATALAIMWQWHCWCAGAVNMMRQCWRSFDSGAVDAPAPSTWCRSAVDHATVASLMCWCPQHDATVLSIVRQWRHWRGGAVNMMRQHCR